MGEAVERVFHHRQLKHGLPKKGYSREMLIRPLPGSVRQIKIAQVRLRLRSTEAALLIHKLTGPVCSAL